jgi:hypothetical protein
MVSIKALSVEVIHLASRFQEKGLSTLPLHISSLQRKQIPAAARNCMKPSFNACAP